MTNNFQKNRYKFYRAKNRPSRSPNHKRDNFHQDRHCDKCHYKNKHGLYCSADCMSKLKPGRYSCRSKCSSPEHRRCSILLDMRCISWWFGRGRSELDMPVGTVVLNFSRRRALGRPRNTRLILCGRSTWSDRQGRR